jgi:protein CpxP
MKKLVVAALLVVGMTSFAQEKMEDPKSQLTPEQKVNLQIRKLTKELNLNENQIQEIRIVALKEIELREARKAEMEASKKLSKEEMKARKAKFEEERTLAEARMKKILTPEQFTKWIEIRKARKEKMENRIEERKGERLEDGKL